MVFKGILRFKFFNYMNRSFSYFFLTIYLCLIFSLPFVFQNCANKLAPVGGPKDTLSPIIRSTVPRNQSTNYKGNLIVIQFNEWIKEKNLQKELLITPPIKDYTFKVVKDRVELKINEKLRENTTYTFNFRKGITDITEGNVAMSDTTKGEVLKLSFSTGAVIDSLQIGGMVKNLLTNEPLKNAVVSLYKADDTLTVFKHTPYYFTYTDDKGYFNLYNLGAGKYRLYAFTDTNNDLKYKEPEFIGFMPETLLLTDTSKAQQLVLMLNKEDHSPPKIDKSRAVDKEYELVFSEGLKKLKLESTQFRSRISFLLSNDGKTAKIYNTESIEDSISIQVNAIDSLGNILKTESKIAFKPKSEKEKNKEREKVKEKDPRGKQKPTSTNQKLGIDVKLPTGSGFEKDVRMDLVFEKPIITTDFSKIKYRLDGDTLNTSRLLWQDSTQYYQWNDSYNVLTVRRYIRFKESLTLQIDSGAFISILQDSSALLKQKFLLKKPTDFGSISGKIKTNEKSFILQLIDDKYKVINEIRNQKVFDFGYLNAGIYQIRIILDKNENGRWDASDIQQNTPAEVVLFRTLQNNGKLKERWDFQDTLVEF
jgi:uncharacterized protein (DUF2141 family)